ncbi:hypothetical protein JCM5296_005686 [Sporobolomyces johnsonii]
MNGAESNGNNSFNPAKRPLENSPPAPQPQTSSSLFGQPNAFQNSRTIYSGKLGGAFGSPSPAAQTQTQASPSLDGGGNEQDNYSGGGMFYGQRTTGMGRPSSAEAQNGQPMQGHGQEQPRKRLRRGGPGGDEGGDEGPGSFTSNLQNRLADVHVESGPSSSASSVYGGNSASASMAPTPSWNGSAADLQSSLKQENAVPASSSPPVVRPGSRMRPPTVQDSPSAPMNGRSPPMNGNSTLSPSLAYAQFPYQQGAPPPQPQQHHALPPLNTQDPGFQNFLRQVGTGFPMEKIWLAYQRSGGDFTRGLAFLVDAKPLGSPSPGVSQFNAAASYAAVNSPIMSPGTPGAAQYAQHPQLAQQHPQQPRPQIQTIMRPVQQTPQGYARPGMINGVAQAPMMQQPAMHPQQQMAYAAAQGSPYVAQSAHAYQQPPPPRQNYQFPPCAPGFANFTQAHVSHYLELQRGWAKQTLNEEEHRQLVQYINVLSRYIQQGHRPPPQAQAGSSQFYAGGGQQPGAYSHQGVYAAAGGGGGARAMPQQRAPAPKPVQKHHAPMTSGSILARQLAAASGGGSVKKKPAKKKAFNSDSDDDGGDYDSAGSGDEYGARENPAAVARREQLAVEFFNTCEKELLMELAGCNATQATLTMKLRPFNSANDFRTRTRKQKGVGNNMMDTYLDVITGMGEVDKVLSECEQIGRELSAVMQIWSSGAAASASSSSTRPGATSDAEVGLDLVAISEETIVNQVETSNNPAVRAAFKDYIRKQPAGVPDSITLKDYQMLGVNWLNLLYRRGTSCILADEMGLGKTAQVIALLAHLKATGMPGPHLVIVPSSTLENWIREFSVFAPALSVHSYYGSQAERDELRHEIRQLGDELDVVVTTYNIATGSPDDQKFLKRKMDFKTAVFDEGHQLKNSESKKYKDLMQIRAGWRLLLTGTPLQNNLQELVSLLSFILPEQFRDANESLRAIFKVTPGTQTNLLSRERISRAKKMMTPFVLRRKKAQVLKDLPKKFERIEYCEMTPLQKDVYDEAIQRSRRALTDVKEEELEEMGSAPEDGGDDVAAEAKPKKGKKKAVAASTKTGNKADTTSSAHVLTDLRKASNHPMLFRRLYDEKKLRLMSKDCLREEEFMDRNKDLIFEDMEVMTDFELHRFCQGYKNLEKYCLQNDEWMSAGKIDKLKELLPALKANGDRVLIFSQFTQVLDILEVVLDTMGIKYLKLTGQTNVTERQGLCDAYNNDPEITVFLLSTRAGGLGLNLTAANTVMFYDCDYNPHNDKQAEDRAYRIGQTRDVTIIKLITRGSIDEDMHNLARTKLHLEREVSSGVDGPATAEADEGGGQQVEKKMRSSLLKNLQQRFNAETQGQGQTQQTQAVPSEEAKAEA